MSTLLPYPPVVSLEREKYLKVMEEKIKHAEIETINFLLCYKKITNENYFKREIHLFIDMTSSSKMIVIKS